MSDVFYAVQFRSMHTAIHSIAIFSLEDVATEFFNILETTEEMPDEIAFPFDPANFVDILEIDFRRPPQHWPSSDDPDGVRLVYVNNPENYHPDVYGY